jgi:hypothetical protein
MTFDRGKYGEDLSLLEEVVESYEATLSERTKYDRGKARAVRIDT